MADSVQIEILDGLYKALKKQIDYYSRDDLNLSNLPKDERVAILVELGTIHTRLSAFANSDMLLTLNDIEKIKKDYESLISNIPTGSSYDDTEIKNKLSELQEYFSVNADKLSDLFTLKSSSLDIDYSVNRKQIVLPKALISKGKDIVKFNTLAGAIFQPGEKSSVYSIGNTPFFDGDSYIELKEIVSATSSIILPCDFSLLGSKFISIYVWVDDWYNFSNITLELSINGGSNFYDKLSILLKTKTTVLPNHWNNIKIPISDFVLAGSATYQSDIKSIRLSTNNVSGKIPNIKFGGLKLDVKSRTAITFSFDDAMYSDYTVVMPKLNSYGFKFTTFIISSLIGTNFGGLRLTLPQLQEILSNGNYIGVHGTSVTTNWVSTATLAQAESHIKDCLKYIIDNGLSNDGMHYAAYPMGEYNDDIIALLKKYNFKGARTTDSRTQNSPVEDLFKLKLGFELYPTLQENIDALEDKILKGGLINLYQHEISASSVTGPISPEVFNQFVDYIYQHHRHLVTSIPDWVNDYETGVFV